MPMEYQAGLLQDCRLGWRRYVMLMAAKSLTAISIKNSDYVSLLTQDFCNVFGCHAA
jgi:hypothetical protein